MDQGKLYSYPGNYEQFVTLKEERQNMELAAQRKRKSLLRTELEWLHRGARARSTKQKAHIDRIRALQEMKDLQEEKRVMLDSTSSRMGNKTIELSGIGKSYGEKELIKDYSYIFLRHDRIGIIGPNGCGKTTLLKIISGVAKPDQGIIEAVSYTHLKAFVRQRHRNNFLRSLIRQTKRRRVWMKDWQM